MSSQESRKHIHYEGLAVTSLVIGGIATGAALTNVEPANAEQPRVSVAVTNIQSNLNSQSFAAEIVGPDFLYFTGGNVDITYQNAASASPGPGTSDASQIVIDTATFNANTNNYSSGGLVINTVEAATARAIIAATQATRFGDVIGIVNAYNGPPTTAEGESVNPRASIAITNIQSNANSQNFAAEVVGPELGVFFTQISASVDYQNATLVGSSDQSQFLIYQATVTVVPTEYTLSTSSVASVEEATAYAIDTAKTANRYGDVIGIVRAWNVNGAALD